MGEPKLVLKTCIGIPLTFRTDSGGMRVSVGNLLPPLVVDFGDELVIKRNEESIEVWIKSIAPPVQWLPSS